MLKWECGEIANFWLINLELFDFPPEVIKSLTIALVFGTNKLHKPF